MSTSSSFTIIMTTIGIAFGMILGSGFAEISREEISDMSKKNVAVEYTMAKSKNMDEVEGVCYASSDTINTMDVENYPYSISAQAACKIARGYSDRVFKEQMKEIYNKIYTAASDGYFDMRVYSDEISVKCVSSDTKKIIETLESRGYDVTMTSIAGGFYEWVLIIDWSDCYKEDK